MLDALRVEVSLLERCDNARRADRFLHAELGHADGTVCHPLDHVLHLGDGGQQAWNIVYVNVIVLYIVLRTWIALILQYFSTVKDCINTFGIYPILF